MLLQVASTSCRYRAVPTVVTADAVTLCLCRAVKTVARGAKRSYL
jgi:hypothetical protein